MSLCSACQQAYFATLGMLCSQLECRPLPVQCEVHLGATQWASHQAGAVVVGNWAPSAGGGAEGIGRVAGNDPDAMDLSV